MTEAQKQLKRQHGTPDEFEAACYRAFCDLFITHKEYLAAVARYQDKWNAAGKKR